jgi:hypothetical protein
LAKNAVIRGDPGCSAKILTAAGAGWRFRPSGGSGDGGLKAMSGHAQLGARHGRPEIGSSRPEQACRIGQWLVQPPSRRENRIGLPA